MCNLDGKKDNDKTNVKLMFWKTENGKKNINWLKNRATNNYKIKPLSLFEYGIDTRDNIYLVEFFIRRI